MAHPGPSISQHDMNYLRQPSSSPIMSRLSAPGSSTVTGPTPFRAPAHKHAHHLHSIPPREKSTRTLIIDHLLWVHARTRFSQARAELGMTDRTGGPPSSNYAHRERPENYEEEEEVYSDGEDVATLTARSGGPGHTHEDAEDERLERQDLALARNLRQRAESVEKVATAMLDQPPEVPPIHPDDLLDPPTSPKLLPQNQSLHQHTLPNGVRLRLALATVINDLFSRRAPSRPPNSRPVAASSSSSPTSSLPPALVPLADISSASYFFGLSQNANPDAPPPVSQRHYPTDYIRSLYDIGADPDTQNSPPALRCPRHLHMGCEICVEAKAQGPPRSGGRSRSTGRAVSSAGSSPADQAAGTSNSAGAPGGGVTGWQDGSGIGSGLSRSTHEGTVLRRPSVATIARAGDQRAMHNTKLAELIVRFMRLSALVAIELGREALEDRASVDGGEPRHSDPSSSGSSSGRPTSSNGPLSNPAYSPQTSPRTLTHRNLATADGLYYYALRPSREWYFLFAGLLTRAVFEGYMTAGWRGIEPLEILIGIGLGAVPQPPRPPVAEETGQSANGPAGSSSGDAVKAGEKADEDEFKNFDPDDLPNLDDAARLLFPSLREEGSRREGAELEYEIEMIERLGRFYDVPQSTPDLATHMEDLAWQYPAEAVERAAVRFCEAIARWRGKPELETYKKAPWIVNQRAKKANTGGAAMSIDSLVHSNPTSPSTTAVPEPTTEPQSSMQRPPSDSRPRRPSIERYFTLPQNLVLHGRKRRRDETDKADEARRMPAPPYA
ncbi:hypothetical protein CERSUDRAFT_117402 [Gelatoporia subvermispora B]|uniref:Uncharacterized protein n=1 Tax=Ceriporiopsis subvermispora (strain B) TaxID=914234 RepID=M2R4P7_CERS8|nr:hypothetical protein CERSUDRAFT_117402 [Gelatoporia subvermispora B]